MMEKISQGLDSWLCKHRGDLLWSGKEWRLSMSWDWQENRERGPSTGRLTGRKLPGHLVCGRLPHYAMEKEGWSQKTWAEAEQKLFRAIGDLYCVPILKPDSEVHVWGWRSESLLSLCRDPVHTSSLTSHPDRHIRTSPEPGNCKTNTRTHSYWCPIPCSSRCFVKSWSYIYFLCGRVKFFHFLSFAYLF